MANNNQMLSYLFTDVFYYYKRDLKKKSTA